MNTEVDVDSLLDANLDDLADLPSFAPYPPGVHDVKTTMGLKDVNGKKTVTVDFEYVGMVELADPTSAVPEVGSKCNILCQLDNPYGQGTFKMFIKASAEANGIPESASNRQKMEACNATVLRIVSSIRKNKETGAEYLQVKEVVMPA